jgi:hypothetical protein
MNITQSAELWEIMAAIAVTQNQPPHPDRVLLHDGADIQKLIAAAGLPTGPTNKDLAQFNFDAAFRHIDRLQMEACYFDALAKVSGLQIVQEYSLKFPGAVQTKPSIVLSPFELKSDMQIPAVIWVALIKQLKRMTGFRTQVHLVGPQDYRLEDATLTEDEIKTWQSPLHQLQFVAGADVVIGVPNAYMWAATGFDRKVVVLLPEQLPTRRWWPWGGKQNGIGLYDARNLQAPVLLASVRKLMDMVEVQYEEK